MTSPVKLANAPDVASRDAARVRPAPAWARRALLLATLAVVTVGAVIRLQSALLHHGVLYPDETYQMTEAAHRIVFGYGITPWEFVQGLRSWLGPGFLLPPTALGGLLGLDGLHLMMIVKAWVVLWSTAGLVAVVVLARRLEGPVAGLLAACFAAFSPLSAVYDTHPLADTVAAPLPVLALACVATSAGGRRGTVVTGIGGALLVAGVALRPQLGVVALSAVAAVALSRSRRRLLALGVGLLGGAAVSGLVDLLTWGVPFAPTWRAVTFNVVNDGASLWGRQPAVFYLRHGLETIGPLLAALTVVGLMLALLPAEQGRPARLPTWPLVAGVVAYVAVLSAIGHKELRFVVPVLPLVWALAAVGWARAAYRIRAVPRGAAPAVIAAISLLVAVTSGLVLPGVRMQDLGYPRDTRSAWVIDDVTPRLLSRAGTLPGVCGVALVSPRLTWAGGYSYLHRDVPLQTVRTTPDPAFYRDWANVILISIRKPLPAGYTAIARLDREVLARRPGGCTPPPPDLASRIMLPPATPAPDTD